METKWQLQDVKNRFSELVEKAINLGPQTVTRRGVDAVVVLAGDDYKNSPDRNPIYLIFCNILAF